MRFVGPCWLSVCCCCCSSCVCCAVVVVWASSSACCCCGDNSPLCCFGASRRSTGASSGGRAGILAEFCVQHACLCGVVVGSVRALPAAAEACAGVLFAVIRSFCNSLAFALALSCALAQQICGRLSATFSRRQVCAAPMRVCKLACARRACVRAAVRRRTR